MTLRSQAPTIGLRVSGPWMVVPIDADDPLRAAGREAERFVERTPELAGLRDRFVDELVVSASECGTREVLAAAFYAAVSETGMLIEGWLEVSASTEDWEAATGEPTDLVAVLGAARADDTRPPEAEARALPAGRAIRVRGARDVQGQEAGNGFVVEYLHLWFEAPDPQRFVVVRAMTPCVGLSDQFVASVDELADTLTVEW